LVNQIRRIGIAGFVEVHLDICGSGGPYSEGSFLFGPNSTQIVAFISKFGLEFVGGIEAREINGKFLTVVNQSVCTTKIDLFLGYNGVDLAFLGNGKDGKLAFRSQDGKSILRISDFVGHGNPNTNPLAIKVVANYNFLLGQYGAEEKAHCHCQNA
jgi:hypothetical protein